jgi:hypothetical protein
MRGAGAGNQKDERMPGAPPDRSPNAQGHERFLIDDVMLLT